MPVPKKKQNPGVEKDELSKFQSRWRTVVESGIPDNQYLAWVHGSLEKLDSGSLQIHWHFKIADGKCTNSVFNQVQDLETDSDLRVLAQRLKVLGFEPQGMPLSELPKALNEIQSNPVLVKISMFVDILIKVNSEQFTKTPIETIPEPIKSKKMEKSEPVLKGGAKVWFVKGGKVHEGTVSSLEENDMVKVKVDSEIVEVSAARCEIII